MFSVPTLNQFYNLHPDSLLILDYMRNIWRTTDVLRSDEANSCLKSDVISIQLCSTWDEHAVDISNRRMTRQAIDRAADAKTSVDAALKGTIFVFCSPSFVTRRLFGVRTKSADTRSSSQPAPSFKLIPLFVVKKIFQMSTIHWNTVWEKEGRWSWRTKRLSGDSSNLFRTFTVNEEIVFLLHNTEKAHPP